MKALSRHDLRRWLSARGIDREAMAWSADVGPVRMLIREAAATGHTSDDAAADVAKGPHRPVRMPDEGVTLKIPLGDRPALGSLAARMLAQATRGHVCAFGQPDAFWLNNRGYASYLARVADSARVHRFLRRAGVGDRFRGGFLIQPFEYESHIPLLAAQPFCGGPDVMFASSDRLLLVLACHEFDLHVETPDRGLADEIARMAAEAGLEVRRGDAGACEEQDVED